MAVCVRGLGRGRKWRAFPMIKESKSAFLYHRLSVKDILSVFVSLSRTIHRFSAKFLKFCRKAVDKYPVGVL